MYSKKVRSIIKIKNVFSLIYVKYFNLLEIPIIKIHWNSFLCNVETAWIVILFNSHFIIFPISSGGINL